MVPKPGTLCDSRLISQGDSSATNYTLFQWSIATIDTPNAGDSALSYTGWTLDNCDITLLYVNGDANTFIIDFTALVSCQADEFQVQQGNNYEVTLRTDWPQSELAGPGGHPTLQLTRGAHGDFAERVFQLEAFTNGSFPVIISFQADFPWCPASLGRDAPCALQVPPLNITSMFECTPGIGSSSFDATLPLSSTNQLLTANDTAGIIANLIQLTYAAVHLDLGNPSPNNFLLNTSVIPQTIVAFFPRTFPGLANESGLYSLLVNDGYYQKVNGAGASQLNITGLLPLTAPGPAIVYLCHFQRAKSPGSAFIAVLVATLSMFSSDWALFIVFAAALVERRYPPANTCAHHANTSGNSSQRAAQKELFM
ncbi:hypothetical protein B0H17DRAFT_1133620 [Mycena rosella]|uniref:Uncharacterized protein n=1 Tax=Mycena rosella TaxID=1033263 RepID=A0AAD7GJ49_MYCRO|nr:hypothetical protein B0H17DRAFT_1133620 [Mycena rosella]